MDGNIILVIAIWSAVGLVGVSLLGLVLFGLRNLSYGKSEPLTIAAISIPVIVLGVLGVAMPTWAEAGILTVLLMFGLSLIGLVYTGITNLFW